MENTNNVDILKSCLNGIPFDLSEYAATLSSEDTDILFQLIQKDDQGTLQDIRTEDVLRMPFERAKQCIQKFALSTRIRVLKDLDARRTYLYDQASEYGEKRATDDPNYVSPDDWRLIMGKIKHLEILQAWLYGIE